ncbi:MAG: hypothetical protein JO314_13875 [Acidobacteria bacterium]|nr:hypothetical protein [Acidobacteriota bacterium]
MSVLETIREKVFHLPHRAQEEVLREVEEIEERYRGKGIAAHRHALDEIAEVVVEGLPEDLSVRHDSYAHAKVED